VITIEKTQTFTPESLGKHGQLIFQRFSEVCARMGLVSKGYYCLHTLSNGGVVIDTPLAHVAGNPGYVEVRSPLQGGPSVTVTCQEACMLATSFALLWAREQCESDVLGELHQHLQRFLLQQEHRTEINQMLD
jgi:hypothetical protein